MLSRILVYKVGDAIPWNTSFLMRKDGKTPQVTSRIGQGESTQSGRVRALLQVGSASAVSFCNIGRKKRKDIRKQKIVSYQVISLELTDGRLYVESAGDSIVGARAAGKPPPSMRSVNK